MFLIEESWEIKSNRVVKIGVEPHIHQLKEYFQTKDGFSIKILLSVVHFIKVGISNKP